MAQLASHLICLLVLLSRGLPPTGAAGVEGKEAAGCQMGCALSGPGAAPETTLSKEKRVGLDLSEETECRESPEPLHLSESQKTLIQESWKILHKDIARIGVIVFTRLFETHPEVKDFFFLFWDIDDLQKLKMRKELQAHGLRVMSFIEKSVARLDEVDKLEHLAFDLGRHHFWHKAPPKYYEDVGVQFIQVVQPILKEHWTLEVEKAWESLFKYLAATMRRGFYTEKTAGAGKSPSSGKACAESTPNKI